MYSQIFFHNNQICTFRETLVWSSVNQCWLRLRNINCNQQQFNSSVSGLCEVARLLPHSFCSFFKSWIIKSNLSDRRPRKQQQQFELHNVSVASTGAEQSCSVWDVLIMQVSFIKRWLYNSNYVISRSNAEQKITGQRVKHVGSEDESVQLCVCVFLLQ